MKIFYNLEGLSKTIKLDKKKFLQRMQALGLLSASQRETNTASDYYRAQFFKTNDLVS